jgi:hypothetical protein
VTWLKGARPRARRQPLRERRGGPVSREPRDHRRHAGDGRVDSKSRSWPAAVRHRPFTASAYGPHRRRLGGVKLQRPARRGGKRVIGHERPAPRVPEHLARDAVFPASRGTQGSSRDAIAERDDWGGITDGAARCRLASCSRMSLDERRLSEPTPGGLRQAPQADRDAAVGTAGKQGAGSLKLLLR